MANLPERTAVDRRTAEAELDAALSTPICLNGALMDTTEQWAHDIKRTRHIGDFSRWKEHDAYQKAFDRLLRDLQIEKK